MIKITFLIPIRIIITLLLNRMKKSYHIKVLLFLLQRCRVRLRTMTEVD